MSRRNPRDITPRQLLAHWLRYAEFRRPSIAHSTYERDYRKVRKLIERIPLNYTNAIEIRDWVIKNHSADYARRMVMQFNAACQWAYDSDLFPSSPFAGMSRHLPQSAPANDYRAFTIPERDAIIHRFREIHPSYLPWVQFLFWVGCRPEEARALRWHHIKSDLSIILFRVAEPVDTKRVQKTKNRKERDFPTNSKIRFLLQSLKHYPYDPNDYVLKGVEGGAFEYHNFQHRCWKPLITEMVEERKVFLYLSQYHMRHTWITLALAQGMDIPTVAYLSGNTPEVIMRHYASRQRLDHLPDI